MIIPTNKCKIYFLLLPFAFLLFSLPANAQTCSPAPVGLVSWWSGDGNALDSRSRNNGTLQNGATFAGGNVGQGFNFSGTANVTIPNSASLNPTSGLTLEAWINPSSCPNQYCSIITKSDVLNGNGRSYGLWLGGSGSFGGLGSLTVGGSGDPSSNYAFTAASVITNGAFSHVAATITPGGNFQLYINGILQSVTQVGTGNLGATNAAVMIGRSDPGFSYNFEGLIDEPAIYNRALSATQIQAIFNSGTAGKCKPTATVSPSGQVGFWSGDGNANDIAGTNNGTLQNGADFAIGKVGQGFSFDGSDDIVQIADSPSLNFAPTAQISAEMWVYRTSPSPVQHFIGKRGSGCIGSNINYQMAFNESTGDGLVWGGSNGEVHSNVTLPMNTWTHLAGTFDGTTLRMYMNGSLIGSVAGNNGATNSSPLTIGNSNTCGAFGGKIDEPAIFNRTLTTDEITSIFNAGIAGKLKDNTTATGSNVAVNTKSDATVTFPNVTTAGITQQIPIDLSLFPSLPSGSTSTGLTSDIATSSVFTGSPQVCFNLPSITTSPAFNNLRILHLESGSWINRTNLASINFATRTICTNSGLTSLSPFAVVNGFIPTAAESSISGRVTTASGHGIRNVIVQISGGNLNEIRYARTNPFGYYRISGLDSGQTYILNVASKQYSFANPTRVITLNEDLTGEDFVSDNIK